MNRLFFKTFSKIGLLIFLIASFLIIKKISKLYGNSHNTTVTTQISQFSDTQITTLLQELNQAYYQYEHHNPQQGYCVTIQTSPTLQGKITPHGGPRNSKALSGMPQSQSDYIKTCPFCNYVQDNYTDKNIVQNFGDQTYAVKSLSNQILVISDEHYAHIFAMPEDLQCILLKNMLQLRSDNPTNIARPIEFHCGSAAGQTVFHTHGRSGVYRQ